ncbi:hypothetical protein B0H19DRAFT_1060565 [Mycena capillaripes]|nr:hypothetical protein B0H19DRAFT_1060565 [Mycena capillaripes]
MSTFLDLPSEVLLLTISTFLEIREVLLLRRTCRGISVLTYDKTVWLTFLERLRSRGDVPLPPSAGDSAIDLSSSTLESIVVSALRAADSWELPRKLKPVLKPSHGQSILGLNIFLDTWLLIVYVDGLVYLWDIRESAPRQGYCDTLDLREPGMRWSSYIASLVPNSEQIMFSISSGTSKRGSEGQYQTVLYSINIGTSYSTDNIFNLVESFSYSTPRTILAIDIANCFLVLSSSTWTLDILRWDMKKENTSTICLDDNDTEESYNGVVALRLLGSHCLAIRTHTIELHLWDNGLRSQKIQHRLHFPFRDGAVSVSEIIAPGPTSTSELLSERIHINILAYDGHSLACYAVAIDLPGVMSVGAPPAMEVTRIGEVCPAPTQLTPLTRSHWFVSAHTLGPQSIRAMWIERHNLTMTRHVRLCTLNRNTTWHEMNAATNAFLLSSYDLREDLTHCALAELSGHIALGNRSGHVFLLPANHTTRPN